MTLFSVMDCIWREYNCHMKRLKDNSNRTTKDTLADSLHLPKDICTGSLRITLTGDSEAWIENYKGILEYTEECVILQAKGCRVCFEGTRLLIDYYTNEDMRISGCIQGVRYL